MKKFKNGLFAALALILLFAMVIPAAAETAVTTQVMSDTQIATSLGMLFGDGKGVTDEYLAKSTTRLQAAIMFLRLKGLEATAKSFSGTTNFSDAKLVSSSNMKTLAYLKANPQLGWVGSGNGKFNPLSIITAQEFYKVLAEALGYMHGVDFEYADVIVFAKTIGLSKVANVTAFTNTDIATATVEALKVVMKGSTMTLIDMLVAMKIVDAAKAAVLAYPRIDVMTSATLGNYLVDSNGKTLYYFTKDFNGKSACNSAACLGAWPVYYAENLQIAAGLDAEDFSTITRDDSSKQTTYYGWPLYYFAADKVSGDTKGEAVGGVWFVVDPAKFTGSAAAKAVTISGFAFSPQVITVMAGAEVTFTNKDDVSHTVTADDGSFDSGLIAKNQTYKMVFAKPGEYKIHCTPHPSMTATIIVK